MHRVLSLLMPADACHAERGLVLYGNSPCSVHSMKEKGFTSSKRLEAGTPGAPVGATVR